MHESLRFSFAMSAQMVQPFLERRTLAEALKDRKIYLIDLTYMARIDCASRKEVCVSQSLVGFSFKKKI